MTARKQNDIDEERMDASRYLLQNRYLEEVLISWAQQTVLNENGEGVRYEPHRSQWFLFFSDRN